ncbi:hypothetical protein [Aeromonas sobria]|uniref:hypothetical protein n=1 Tax=Aeromonas sobria TaxID=646 RepID=UPI00111AC729|nr:hypothetical protein [Aeromonas sobria]TNH91672.1 hypothetical protein CF137_20845 [Aeromonas sobria]
MITFNEKTQAVTLCGQTMTLEYLQCVQAPLLVDALHWSVPTLVNWMESAGIPLGQFARVPKVQNHLIEREEAHEKARKEQAERERLAYYNSPEQVAERKRQAEELHKYRLKQAAELRSGVNQRGLRGGDVDYAPTAMFDL